MPETMTAHMFPVPPARLGSALDPSHIDNLPPSVLPTPTTLRAIADRRTDSMYDQSFSSDLSFYGGLDQSLTDLPRPDPTEADGTLEEHAGVNMQPVFTLDQSRDATSQSDIAREPTSLAADTNEAETSQTNNASDDTTKDDITGSVHGSQKPMTQDINSQSVQPPSQSRNVSKKGRRGAGSRASIATLSSVITNGDSVYEDALETPNETGDEQDDEDDVTDFYSTLPLEIPSTPPKGALGTVAASASTPGGTAVRSPFMDLNVVPPSPASTSRSVGRESSVRSEEKQKRRQSLQDPMSPTIIPLRRASATSGAAATSPSRRHSSISSLSGSDSNRGDHFGSPSSPPRDSRRQSFTLKPLVLSPQKTVIVTGPVQTPMSPARRLSSDFSSSHSPARSAGPHRRNSSVGVGVGVDGRSVSPFGTTTAEGTTPPLSLSNGHGPTRRRSMGYFEPGSLSGDNDTPSVGRRFRTASVDTGTTTLTNESSLLDMHRRASTSTASTMSGRASPQLTDQEWDQQYRKSGSLSSSTASSVTTLPIKPKSRPPPSSSLPLLRGYAAAALVGSHFSPMQTPQQMSPVPESPLLDSQQQSDDKETVMPVTYPVVVTSPKLRRPAKYDEHWNGEAFESSPELSTSPRMANGLAPAHNIMTAALRRPSSPREFQATFASPIVEVKSTSPESTVAPHRPIMIKAGTERRGSRPKVRLDPTPPGTASSTSSGAGGGFERRESAPADLQRGSVGVSRRTSAFSLHRLSKVIADEMKSPQRGSTHLPTSARPISGLATWPPPESEETKKMSAGPRLESSPAASPQVDQETPAFGPIVDNVGTAPYPFRSNKRPSLLPRDPRAHIEPEGPDSFLDLLLNEEPPPRPTRRASVFDEYDGGRDHHRNSTSSYASTISTLKSQANSPQGGSVSKSRFASVFSNRLPGSAANKHRKSSGDVSIGSLDAHEVDSAPSKQKPVKINGSGRAPITIGSKGRSASVPASLMVNRSQTPPARPPRPPSIDPATGSRLESATSGHNHRQKEESDARVMDSDHANGPDSTQKCISHDQVAKGGHDEHSAAHEPAGSHSNIQHASSQPLKAGALKFTLPPGLGASPDKSVLVKGSFTNTPQSSSETPQVNDHVHLRATSPTNRHRPRDSVMSNGSMVGSLQRQLERPISPTQRDSIISALSSGSGSTTKATIHAAGSDLNPATTQQKVAEFASEPTVQSSEPVNLSTTLNKAQQPTSGILIRSKEYGQKIQPLQELPSTTRAKKQASFNSLQGRKLGHDGVHHAIGQVRDTLRSQVLER
ncbi:hypothetical protein OIO90_000332 [Microbotryomycetes sp. JL221]|nr:hypothetical protein OIO90_000332 [Microbotryomycetes sp. JL221]